MFKSVHHLSYSDSDGGAARATYRIHNALKAYGIDSTLIVNHKALDDYLVSGPKLSKSLLLTQARIGLLRPLKALSSSSSSGFSPSLIPSSLPFRLNKSSVDIVNLHWIQNEMLSILDIPRITKPIVWTLHDMWAFCGAEHYSTSSRWETGYLYANRSSSDSGLDFNRFIWLLKKKLWRKPIHIICPSIWLAECVKNSALMSNWPVTVIPNTIDVSQWKSIDTKLAREILHLPQNTNIILFGAMNGCYDMRKGFDLLCQALAILLSKDTSVNTTLVIFGQLRPKNPMNFGFPVHYLGFVNDDVTLRLLYSAADVFVIPSRIDNLPNAGLESHACGTPVVGFDVGGLSDIIDHKVTGYLARPADPESLADGIKWILSFPDKYSLRSNTRLRAKTLWSNEVVSKMYLDVYNKVTDLASNTF